MFGRPFLSGFRRTLALLALAPLLLAGRLATPEPTPSGIGINGIATVIDGDGLEIAGRKIRLFGIDAPEVEQYCFRNDGSRWRCGQYATVALDRLVGGKSVECNVREMDAYERAVAVCRAEGKDLSAEQTRAGWAMAYRRYSSDYVAGEDTARKGGVGIWSGRFDPPWQWRARRR